MMTACAFLALLVLSTALALTARWALLSSLRSLLSRTLRIEGGAEFFARSFSLVVLLATIGPALGTNFSFKPDSHLMEAVWAVAAGLGAVIQSLLYFVAVFLIVITVLLAALKPKNDE